MQLRNALIVHAMDTLMKNKSPRLSCRIIFLSLYLYSCGLHPKLTMFSYANCAKVMVLTLGCIEQLTQYDYCNAFNKLPV